MELTADASIPRQNCIFLAREMIKIQNKKYSFCGMSISLELSENRKILSRRLCIVHLGSDFSRGWINEEREEKEDTKDGLLSRIPLWVTGDIS